MNWGQTYTGQDRNLGGTHGGNDGNAGSVTEKWVWEV